MTGETYYGALKVNLSKAFVDWDMDESDVTITIPGFDTKVISFTEINASSCLRIMYSATKMGDCTVEFVVDGSIFDEQIISYNETVIEPTVPKKEGYVLVGWYTENDELYNLSTRVTSDITLTAKFIKGIYFCSFESEADFDAWEFVDADGDEYNWASSSEVVVGSIGTHGEKAICSQSYDDVYGALTPDNYAHSPVIALPQNSNITLCYTAYGSYDFLSNETYTVYVQTSDDELHEVHHETLPDGHDNTNPNSRSIDLSEFAGQDVRIVFRHHDSVHVYNICIDEVLVGAEPTGTKGDLNGDGSINAKDVTILRRYVAGGADVSFDFDLGEFTGDDQITAKDVTMLRRYVAEGWEIIL